MLNRIVPVWRAPLPMTLLVVMAIVVGFYDTAHSMVLIWRDYETFTHGFLIAPISIWLIWQRRKQIAACTPSPSWVGVSGFFAAAFLWLLGDLAGVQVVQHYALVAMIVLSVYAVNGWQPTRVMLAPLIFLFLAVPFGEAFVDPLINWTADFTVAALQMTGIPVFREGNTFSLPSGNWSVVAACSGVRYLIASITLGVVYAYLTYRSLWRRGLFILASIVVPIIANGLRAYMIVMIGHLSNMEYAVGVDHLIYGWIFFGVVMLLLFWVGSFWREDLDETPPPAPDLLSTSGEQSRGTLALVTIVTLAIAMAAPYYSSLAVRVAHEKAPVVLSSPDVPGWTQTPEAFTSWRPGFSNPSAETTSYYTKGGERRGMFIAFYRHQRQGSELIHSENMIARPGGSEWRRISDIAQPTGEMFTRESVILGNDQRLIARYWYWVGGHITANAFIAKAHQAWGRLLLRGDDAAVVVVFSKLSEDTTTDHGLSVFAIEAIPAANQALASASGR